MTQKDGPRVSQPGIMHRPKSYPMLKQELQVSAIVRRWEQIGPNTSNAECPATMQHTGHIAQTPLAPQSIERLHSRSIKADIPSKSIHKHSAVSRDRDVEDRAHHSHSLVCTANTPQMPTSKPATQVCVWYPLAAWPRLTSSTQTICGSPLIKRTTMACAFSHSHTVLASAPSPRAVPQPLMKHSALWQPKRQQPLASHWHVVTHRWQECKSMYPHPHPAASTGCHSHNSHHCQSQQQHSWNTPCWHTLVTLWHAFLAHQLAPRVLMNQ